MCFCNVAVICLSATTWCGCISIETYWMIDGEYNILLKLMIDLLYESYENENENVRSKYMIEAYHFGKSIEFFE